MGAFKGALSAESVEFLRPPLGKLSAMNVPLPDGYWTRARSTWWMRVSPGHLGRGARMFLSLEEKGTPQRAGQLKRRPWNGYLGSLGHHVPFSVPWPLSQLCTVKACARLHPSQLGKERGQYTSYREPEPWPSEAHSCVHLGQTVPSRAAQAVPGLCKLSRLRLRVDAMPASHSPALWLIWCVNNLRPWGLPTNPHYYLSLPPEFEATLI